MWNRLTGALVVVCAVFVMAQMLSARRVIVYDARTRQIMMPICETCKLVDPDHCWSCWIAYWGNGCPTCPSSPGDASATLAKTAAKQ